MWYLLAIGWTGQAFSGAQILALRNAAARHMRSNKKQSTLHFKHSDIEGEITRGKVGVYGGFSGTFFHADCGQVNGERWTMDFLLPNGSEQIYLTAEDTVVVSRVTRGLNDEPGLKHEVVQEGTHNPFGKEQTVH